MTSEEIIRKVLDTVLWTRNASDDNKNILTNSLVKAIEQEPFINKPCVSSGACEHDKQKVLDKIRAEIKDLDIFYDNDYFSGNRDAMFKCNDVLQVIDKYKGEKEQTDV